MKLGKHSVISNTAVTKKDISEVFIFWFWKQSINISYNHNNGACIINGLPHFAFSTDFKQIRKKLDVTKQDILTIY